MIAKHVQTQLSKRSFSTKGDAGEDLGMSSNKIHATSHPGAGHGWGIRNSRCQLASYALLDYRSILNDLTSQNKIPTKASTYPDKSVNSEI